MNGSFAAWLSSWSRQTPRKSRYISSTTGRIPAIAAPTPRPTIAVSEIGVSRTRSPNSIVQSSCQPEHVAAGTDVDPGDEHAIVGGELGVERGADRIHGAEHRRRRRGGGGGSACAGLGRTTKSVSVAAAGGFEAPRLVDRFVQLACDRRLQRRDLVVGDACGQELLRVEDERIARFPVVHLVGRSVALRVAFVVTVPAIGGGLDDGGTASAADRLTTSSCIAVAVAVTSLPSTPM